MMKIVECVTVAVWKLLAASIACGIGVCMMGAGASEQVLYACGFEDGDLSEWLHEGAGRIGVQDGALLMETTGEAPRSAVTWLTRSFEGPLRFA